jgi:hypothetical protein
VDVLLLGNEVKHHVQQILSGIVGKHKTTFRKPLTEFDTSIRTSGSLVSKDVVRAEENEKERRIRPKGKEG